MISHHHSLNHSDTDANCAMYKIIHQEKTFWCQIWHMRWVHVGCMHVTLATACWCFLQIFQAGHSFWWNQQQQPSSTLATAHNNRQYLSKSSGLASHIEVLAMQSQGAQAIKAAPAWALEIQLKSIDSEKIFPAGSNLSLSRFGKIS